MVGISHRKGRHPWANAHRVSSLLIIEIVLDQRESHQTRVYILRSGALWALRLRLVGEKKKGKYVYYHCTGNKRKCPEPYAREEVLEACSADLLKGLVFDDEVMDGSSMPASEPR